MGSVNPGTPGSDPKDWDTKDLWEVLTWKSDPAVDRGAPGIEDMISRASDEYSRRVFQYQSGKTEEAKKFWTDVQQGETDARIKKMRQVREKFGLTEPLIKPATEGK